MTQPESKEKQVSYQVTLDVVGGANGVLQGRLHDEQGNVLAGGANLPVSGLKGITTKGGDGKDKTEVTSFPFKRFTIVVEDEDMTDASVDPFVRNKPRRTKGVSDEAVFKMLQRKIALEEGLAGLSSLTRLRSLLKWSSVHAKRTRLPRSAAARLPRSAFRRSRSTGQATPCHAQQCYTGRGRHMAASPIIDCHSNF